jgi:hypothetical protein
MNYLYGSLAILIALLGIEQYGEHRVQTRWDIETARLRAIADQEKRQDKEINAILEAKHLKDIQYAKTQSAKSAIAGYVKSHGLLHSEGSCSKTASSGVSDGTAGESGTSADIEEFASACAHDAQIILDWQEWALRENLPIGD